MKKFLAFVAGVLGLGLVARFATRKAEAQGPTKATLKPQMPPIPVDPPPEPTGGWQAHMPSTATQQAIADCRNAGTAADENELRICALTRIFPTLNWVARGGWQVQAWNEMGKQVFIAAEVEGWPFFGGPGVHEIAVKFWLVAHRVVRA